MSTNKVQIIIASDSHNDSDFILELVNKHPNASFYFHLGDSELPSRYLEPFISVLGNCDYYEHPKERIIEINNHRLYLFHGDSIWLNDKNLLELAKKNNCDVIMHGHTHHPYVKEIDGIILMCPGSIRYPRYDYPTYALMEIDKDVNVKIIEYGIE